MFLHLRFNLDFPNSTHEEIMRSKYNKVHVATFAHTHMLLICSRLVYEYSSLYFLTILKLVRWLLAQVENVSGSFYYHFSYPNFFTYPNDNDYGYGQRGSDNRGWTISRLATAGCYIWQVVVRWNFSASWCFVTEYGWSDLLLPLVTVQLAMSYLCAKITLTPSVPLLFIVYTWTIFTFQWFVSSMRITSFLCKITYTVSDFSCIRGSLRLTLNYSKYVLLAS